MSSLQLQPIALESCQNTSLRGRRRSSIRPLDFLPRLFPAEAHNSVAGESAIADDLATYDSPAAAPSVICYHQKAIASPLSPLSDAHLSGYSTNIDTPRHHDSLPSLNYIGTSPTSGVASPISPISRKTSLTDLGSSGIPSPSHPERLRLRLASAFFMYFLCGWGDGVTGTVLPYFEAEFHLTSLTSSLLFAGSTAGFASGTLLVEPLIGFLGRFYLTSTKWSFLPAMPFMHRLCLKASHGDIGYSASQARYLAIMFFSILHAFFFVMMGSRGGFPVMFLAYAVAAFARAFITASLNAYFKNGPKQSFGYAYGLWSFGGVISPLVCQTIIASGVPWPHFYFGSLVISAFNTCFLAYTFKPTLKEFAEERRVALDIVKHCSSSRYYHKSTSLELHSRLPSPGGEDTSKLPPVARAATPPRANTLRRVLSMPYQWAFSLFAWLYCGSETTTQGFMVSYLLATRNANPNTVGYVTSGFWGGITVGRFLWGFYSPRLNFTQRKHAIHGCISFPLIAIALIMHLLIWFVNSNIENAFSTSIIGAAYGPIFPACLGMANDILPSEVHMVSMALISAFASLGASLLPFIAGTISSIKGAHTLTNVTVAQAAALLCLWCLFPSKVPLRTYSH